MKTNVVKPVTCVANQTNWVRGVVITLVDRAKLLNNINVYFPPGVSLQVQVQIRKGGSIIVPDQSTFESNPKGAFGDYVTGDGEKFDFPMELEVKKSETFEIWYRNTDAFNNHDIQIHFEFDTLPTKKSQLRS